MPDREKLIEATDRLTLALRALNGYVTNAPQGVVDEAQDALDALTRALAALPAERDDELRVALFDEWKANHAEHCVNQWPHDGPCHYPMPDVLAALSAEPEQVKDAGTTTLQGIGVPSVPGVHNKPAVCFKPRDVEVVPADREPAREFIPSEYGGTDAELREAAVDAVERAWAYRLGEGGADARFAYRKIAREFVVRGPVADREPEGLTDHEGGAALIAAEHVSPRSVAAAFAAPPPEGEKP